MDLRQLQELKRNVPDYRKDFIRLVSRQDAELDAELDDLVEESMSLIDENSRGGQIQDQDSISLALPALFAVFAKDLLDIMKDKNEDAAQVQADFQEEQIRIKYAGAAGFTDVFRQWNEFVDDYVAGIPGSLSSRGFPGSSYTIGGAIKTIQKESVNVVRSILEVGINKGKSAQQIANDIEMYIKPLPTGQRISPFQWVRDKLGTLKVLKIERGEIPAGSVSYNAFRIARTEINNTFRYAVVDLHEGQPWVRGYRWNLSASHPKQDICDDWAEKSPYKSNDLPLGHPHCMCYVTIDLVPIKDIDF